MVKRAKLEGQARKLFFNETNPEANTKKREPATGPAAKRPASHKTPVAAGAEGDLAHLAAKVEALKQMVAGFKSLADSESFKNLTLKDFQK